MQSESDDKNAEGHESGLTYSTLSSSEENVYQHDISDDNHDMRKEAISVVDFEQCELDHNVAFALQKRVNCFAQVQHIEEIKPCISSCTPTGRYNVVTQ